MARERVSMKKIAIVSTIYYKYSHTDVILTRWFDKRDTDKAWGWSGPRSQIVSAYIVQFPENDMGVETLRKNNVPLCKTIHEALCCGGNSLAVDAVLLIGEHGNYPYNRFGQKLYPRKELFDKIVEVFDATGETVPVFNDKHLSWDYDLAKQMIDSSRQRNFRLFASSSLPFCHHKPHINVYGAELGEVVAVFPNVHGQPDHYSYHCLEVVQQCIERRKGFETGIERVTAYLGEEVWKAQDAGLWSKDLFESALKAADPSVENYDDESKREFTTHAFRLEYVDGLKVTLVGFYPLEEFAFALHRRNSKVVEPSRCMEGGEAEYYPHFAALSRVIEDFFWDEIEPFPLERALLTAGISQAMIQAQVLPGVTFPTPHLKIVYTPAAQPVGLDYWEKGEVSSQ
jgi:hypothetical protein